MRGSSFVALSLSLACTTEAAPPPVPKFESALCGRTLGFDQGQLVGDFELNCTGLNSHGGTAVSDFATPMTLVIAQDGSQVAGAEGGPCNLLLQHPLTAPLTPLGITLATLDEPGHASVFTYYRGATWTAADGCLKLDEYERNRGIGEYEGIFQEKSGVQEGTGRFAKFHGKVDWCLYGQRADCPHAFYDAAKAAALGEVVLRTPISTSTSSARAGDCRILIDRASEAVQVDLELAIWNEQHISQYYVGACGGEVGFARTGNSFRFRAGGVAGPGRYGPSTSAYYGPHLLPGFELALPTRLYASNEVQACAVESAGSQILGAATEASECSFEITGTGGFELRCTNTRFAGSAFSVIFPPSDVYTGDFELRAQCALRYR